MEAKTSYTLVGIVVIILIAGLITAALWLSIGFNQKKYKIYAVYMREAVSGLNEESPVKYNGVQVGSVLKIELSNIDPQEVKILLNIEQGTPITTSTTATLMSQGITGTTYIGLSAESDDLTPLQKLPQEPYPIIPFKPSLFTQLDSILKEVSEKVNGVSVAIKEILDKENAANLKHSLANLQIFTGMIAANSGNISQGIQDSRVLLQNMARVSQQLPEVMQEIKKASINLNNTLAAGKLTADNIAAQTIPATVTLLHRLDTITANLVNVSAEIRQNPSVVIRGITSPAPGPGEKR